MDNPNLNVRHIFPMTPYARPKGFVKSPFRYPGGKFYALKYILPLLLCVPHDEYREPFVGGGSIFFAKPRAKNNWINDFEDNLITTYQVIADPILRERLIQRLAKEEASRNRHAEIRQLHADRPLDIAFKTYYLNRTSYSGIIHKPAWGYREGKSAPPASWPKFIRDAGQKLEGIKITSSDFELVISQPAHSGTVLMYLDPPYFHADQKRAYTKSFVLDDHLRLCRVLKSTTHFFCLSYDDCAEIRELYSWAHIYERSWLYNTANINGKSRKTGNELLITNYEVRSQSQPRLFPRPQ